ncbi:uncharacterized protein Dwil_GK24577 [Drosophila willistoni]|uniref:CBF1-interacting co-repressor CIR N-terminal domain-containing protein n=1 Tax=Drosophila willistoni TaxID=7260 RepID=B4N0G6_DROWI|nr:pre-mRNA-splicing factor CWC25 homolog [Drosophila willistoni]EDW77579.2 uncharacterized protein Dwil_GK24577 [Drosophila willistoni]
MGGGDLNLKKSWHPHTMKNQERVWKAEQAKQEEQRKLDDLRKEINQERDREELRRMGESTGVLGNRGATGEAKLEWMYKNSHELINREEYLLGRKIDKSFEILEAEERRHEENTLGVKQPINHVEHECVPFSIRHYRNLESTEQVDMHRKTLEDPLMLIKQREMESRRKLLENPLKLKEIHRILKAEQDSKTKALKKSKKSKKSKDSDNSDDDLDRKLARQVKKLKGGDGSNDLNLDKLLDAKYRTISKQLDIASKPKKNKKKHRSDSSDSDSDEEKRYKKRGRPGNDSPLREGDRRRGRDRSSSNEREHRSRQKDVERKNKRYHSRDRIQRRSRSPSNRREQRNQRRSRSPSPRREQRNQRKSRSPSPRREQRNQRRSRSPSPRREQRNRRKSNSPSLRRQEKPYKSRNAQKDQRRSKSRTPQRDRRRNKSPSPRRDRRRSKSFSPRRDRRRSKSNSNSNQTSKQAQRTSPRRDQNVRPFNAQPTTQDRPQAKPKMAEADREARLREMMDNASWREADRTQSVQKHRDAYAREEAQHQQRDFDKDFINKEVKKAIANQNSISDRIRSNLNNIQRSSGAMDKNFARK